MAAVSIFTQTGSDRISRNKGLSWLHNGITWLKEFVERKSHPRLSSYWTHIFCLLHNVCVNIVDQITAAPLLPLSPLTQLSNEFSPIPTGATLRSFYVALPTADWQG